MVAVSVPPGVPGVVVVDESGVDGEGVSVGKDNPGLVGGRVEVTNAGGADVVCSGETVTQDARLRLMTRIRIQIFFIQGFYLGNIKGTVPKVAHDPRDGFD